MVDFIMRIAPGQILLLWAVLFLSARPALGEEILAVGWSPTDSPVYRLDSEMGDPQFLGTAGHGSLNAMARHPSGAFYCVDGAGILLTIDPDTGAGTAVAHVNLGGADVGIPALAFTVDGTLYAINNGTPDDLYILDIDTGVGTLVGPTGSSTLQGLAAAPHGALYGWDIFTGLHTLNPATGAATDVNAAIDADDEVQCLSFSPEGILYGAHRDLFTLDLDTGELTLVAAMGTVGIRGMDFLSTPPLRLRLLQQGSDAVFCWFTQTNEVYQIQQRANLGSGVNWNNVGPVIPGGGGETCVTNTFAAPRSFFRLQVGIVPP